MEPDTKPAAPPDTADHVGIDYALIATSAAAGLIALLYLVVL